MASTGEPQSLIELRQAGIFRDGRWLVQGIDLAVAPRQIVTLIGPNGSGKSTTAKMALGILSPSEGEALRRPRLRVGYVPQKLQVDWTLPLKVKRLMGLTQSISSSDMLASLGRTGAAHLLEYEVRNLSGGELQRVLLARAIARKPDLLVLDEPVQGVDYSGEIEIYDMIANLRDELGCGILMISHDLHVVMASTDHVVCLNGHVCCRGTPGAVSQSKSFRELFGRRAGLALYEHKHDHEHLPDGRVRHADGSVSESCAGEHCDSPAHGHDHGHHDHAHEPVLTVTEKTGNA
ncbi:metal ABC transporter ATP-binding protein [Roseibium limicola]|uniref:Metal ABC transporter ATP-binding protein n=1 Tax=Roseibium limicola TaxID=2816037 RepID=A0A939ENS4_9HYPH|nr:metal ABC transporter ATP-binding protein [Roseibium limicola]MBO0346150.1 metal ABC transporter ATP-binding protein [Roseibium limicola]